MQKLDWLFFLLAIMHFVSFGIMLGLTQTKLDRTTLYLLVLPVMGMVGVYSWQMGKRIGKNLLEKRKKKDNEK